MNKEITKLTRENHLDHLVRVMPFMAIIYIGQCYLFINMFKGISVGNYCMALGGCLAAMISLMYAYNTDHVVTIYESHITINFKMFFINKILKINDIQRIEVSDPEMSFSNICLFMEDGSKHNIYFVDDAKKMANLIISQKQSFEESQNFQSAA